MTLQIGETAPPFTHLDLNGVPVSLNDYLDRPVLVSFTGLSWCAPCQFEAPILQEIYASSSFPMILVSIFDQNTAALEAAVQQLGLTMPVIQDDPSLSIATDWIGVPVPTGTSYSTPTLFVLEPSPQVPQPPDHHVVCERKVGAEPPAAALKADLIARIEKCLSSSAHPGDGYWEEFNPIPWLDPGPLRLMTPERRDILIALGIAELARNLSDAKHARRLERRAIDAVHDAAKSARSATRAKRSTPSIGERMSTRIVEA